MGWTFPSDEVAEPHFAKAWHRSALMDALTKVRFIRFGGHVPKGGYDVPHGRQIKWPASLPALLG